MKEDNKVQSFLLSNLAIADFLMGVYMLIIAIQDARWKGEYFQHDIAWRGGYLCQMAGALSMLSSEVSVLMLMLITADRFICIVFAFKLQRMNLKKSRTVCGVIWVTLVVIAIVPMFNIRYFYDKESGASFYGRSAVCLPLQLSSDRPAGWEYSVTFFIAMNGVAFLFIFCAYLAIFFAVRLSLLIATSPDSPINDTPPTL